MSERTIDSVFIRNDYPCPVYVHCDVTEDRRFRIYGYIDPPRLDIPRLRRIDPGETLRLPATRDVLSCFNGRTFAVDMNFAPAGKVATLGLHGVERVESDPGKKALLFRFAPKASA